MKAGGDGNEAPGLREQLGATKDAAQRLVTSHVELAKAEFSDIGDEIKKVAVVVGIAIGVVLFVGLLVPIGLVFYVSEWWFGSLGWGVLLGLELGVCVVLACIGIGLGVPGSRIGAAFLGGLVVGAVLVVVLALALPNEAWTRVGDQIAGNIEAGVRPLVVGVGIVALVAAVLGLIWGAVAGRSAGSAIGGLIGGAVLGAIAGALSAVRFGVGPGAALGVAVGLIIWAILLGRALWRQGFDTDAVKARFWPSQTIETTKETIEWVRERTPLGPRP
jgi:hypothetical protein